MKAANFDGSCHDAMEFCKSVFGEELKSTKVQDSPAKNHLPSFQKDKTINAQLRSDASEMSASDSLMPNRTHPGSRQYRLSLSEWRIVRAPAKALRKLSDGVDVTDPLKEMFFGLYGALKDKFGIHGMFQANKQS
jgi:PhnB protein